jgi:hypothetical protein
MELVTARPAPVTRLDPLMDADEVSAATKLKRTRRLSSSRQGSFLHL